ncbi:MAG TPA: PD-(D/E)XK nuclease family protein [Candidatus Solibacter sp.]|nr:PD-(D/E)XK nuclease family protein [Candidatus Solibacter sp.]
MRARAVDFVSRWAASGPVLVVSATREAADEVALAACGAALTDVDRFGFRELVLALSDTEMTRRGLTPVGRVVREALAARVTAVHRSKLSYFAPVAGFPGFPRALTDTFEELRLNGDVPPHEDLALLLRVYEEELAERRFADHASRIAMAHVGLAERLRDTAVVALDVAVRTRAERELLDAVLASAKDRLVLGLGEGEELSLGGLRDEDGGFEIFSTSGEALECVEIARRIGRGGVPFDEVGILLRSPERYQPLVIEALRRAGIPAHCTRGTRRPDAGGRAFLALLHCAEERFSASRFAEYLSLGQMPEGSEPRTPIGWERLLVDAAVIGGCNRWESRLKGLREELERRYRASQDDEERERIERRYASLDNLRDFALPIIDRLAHLPRRVLWREWIEALTSLAEFTLRVPEHVTELFEDLEPMSDIGPVDLNEVLLVLGPRLNARSETPKDARFGKVWVGGIAEARGIAFRHVYLPGVNEGLFPRPPSEDLLGVRRDAEDAELLRVAAACATERLSLSFSRLDLLTGRERVPSFYAFAALRAAGGREIGVREFEDRARSRTGTRIGWPAPADAREAIDDAEFDLATLAPLEKGSGLYLKELPGRAVHSLRTRWTRWDRKNWRPADGLWINEIGNELTTPYTLKERAWSPSVLQQYARCPYRFALHGIFGLRPAERATAIQCMDPVTRGLIYHEVQYQLLREPEPDLEVLAQIVESVALEWEEKLAPAIPQVWRSEVASLHADLRGWWQERDTSWSAEFCELSFGLKDPTGRDPRSRREEVAVCGGYKMRGAIDLVERHRSGALRVVDHKTGRMPDPRPEFFGKGEVLQPMLYALAAEQMLGESVGVGRLHYATIAQNFRTVDVPVNGWTKNQTQQVLQTIDTAIADGRLPAAPREDACKGCEYLPVCGPYEEDRVKLKPTVELDALRELRKRK